MERLVIKMSICPFLLLACCINRGSCAVKYTVIHSHTQIPLTE